LLVGWLHVHSTSATGRVHTQLHTTHDCTHTCASLGFFWKSFCAAMRAASKNCSLHSSTHASGHRWCMGLLAAQLQRLGRAPTAAPAGSSGVAGWPSSPARAAPSTNTGCCCVWSQHMTALHPSPAPTPRACQTRLQTWRLPLLSCVRVGVGGASEGCRRAGRASQRVI
jgi:hypothetical protein